MEKFEISRDMLESQLISFPTLEEALAFSELNPDVLVVFEGGKFPDFILDGDGSKYLGDDGFYHDMVGGGIVSESDPVFTASPAHGITSTMITN